VNLVVYFLFFGALFWLGLYIAQREWKNPILKLLSLSLIFSSVFSAVSILLEYPPFQKSVYVIYIREVFVCITVLLLSGSLLFHRPEEIRKESNWIKIWSYTIVPLFFIVSIGLLWLIGVKSYTLFSQVLVLFCAGYLFITVCVSFRRLVGKSTIWKKLSYVVFVLIYLVGLIFPIMQPERFVILLFVLKSISLFSIGIIIYGGIIVEQREKWIPDFVRSLDYTMLLTFVFSGQIVLMIFLISSFHLATSLLLLLSISISIFVQVYFRHIQAAFDYIAFSTFPKLREERAYLRTTEEIKLFVDEEVANADMNEEELAKMTRRALSHFGDLKKLATNPLTQINLIDIRLEQKGLSKDVLNRANELKSILLECMEQIKPQQEKGFGTTDEWRFYNSLYFPYVIGIKPYSKKYFNDQLSEEEQLALEWFRVNVPERTFYNWSRIGAQLVATKMMEKSAKLQGQ
jgi:hypothetical protein